MRSAKGTQVVGWGLQQGRDGYAVNQVVHPERRPAKCTGNTPTQRCLGRHVLSHESSPAQAGGATAVGPGCDHQGNERHFFFVEQIHPNTAAAQGYCGAHNQGVVHHKLRWQKLCGPYRTALQNHAALLSA